MDRMACVDLPSLPLQQLLQQHPDWRGHPAAVVDQDKPQGVILWVNERARAARILRGMRYAEALSLSGDLHAAEVPSSRIDGEVADLVRRLQRFTPHVEPATGEPGVFWLDASGLERLHDSLTCWADLIRSDLSRAGYRATVVVGFGRFATYAVAKSRQGAVVFQDADTESAAALRVPLDRLALAPVAREALRKLGVDTVGAFVELPAEGIERRFGPDARRLHQLASGCRRVPLQPRRAETPALQRWGFEQPETQVGRLIAIIERLMKPLLESLADKGQTLAELRLGFCFERMGDHIERVRPAAPTLDAAQMLDLVRLRLSAVRKLPDGVVEVVLAADGIAASAEQLQMFAEKPRRDLAAANRALARVRAELGNAAVVHARLREGHLPESRYAWEALDGLAAAVPRNVDGGALVRRIYARPVPLSQPARREPDGWMLRGLQQGPVVRMLGPYIVSGGWWRRPAHREYHFAETQKGELLWIYYDRAERRWFLHGRVE